jgi:excisionase family DNA binding protein
MNQTETVEPGRVDVTPTREYEDKRQLAARLGVSVRTIDNLLLRGLPHLKLTRKLTRFPRGAVDAWLAERQVRRA